ncbi:MAG: tetratricopeptide repeat protein [Bacteroidales bacterium]|nr:tetratricopeptide repeat protein [Bacteroidales bacterium]
MVFYFLAPVNAQKHKKYTRQGNRDYSENKFQDSEMLYRRAIDADPSFSKAIFNLGDALYKQEKYDEASDNFRQISEQELNKKTLADSYYNMGNSLLKSGKLEESIGAYKNALRNEPGNMEAKYNLAYAQDLLEEQKQKQQQQQQDDGSQQEKDQQEEEQSGSDENEDQQQDQDKEPEQSDKKDDRDLQQNQQDQQQISKEDAERLLQALAENEKEVQEKVKKEKAARARVRTLKNW